MDDYATDIAAFVRTEVGEAACLFGHSLGGWIAMSITASLPQAVKGLVVGHSLIYPGNIDPAVSPSYFTHVPIALRGLTTALSQLDPDALAMLYDGRLQEGYEPDTLPGSISCPALLLLADPERGGAMTDCDVERSRQLLAQPAFVGLHNVATACTWSMQNP